jgi:hypothetical protein
LVNFEWFWPAPVIDRQLRRKKREKKTKKLLSESKYKAR